MDDRTTGDSPSLTPQIPATDTERLANLKSTVDALKVARPMTIAMVAVLLAAQVFVLGFLTI